MGLSTSRHMASKLLKALHSPAFDLADRVGRNAKHPGDFRDRTSVDHAGNIYGLRTVIPAPSGKHPFPHSAPLCFRFLLVYDVIGHWREGNGKLVEFDHPVPATRTGAAIIVNDPRSDERLHVSGAISARSCMEASVSNRLVELDHDLLHNIVRLGRTLVRCIGTHNRRVDHIEFRPREPMYLRLWACSWSRSSPSRDLSYNLLNALQAKM